MCKRPLTIGVAHRVEELADRPEGAKPSNAVDYMHLIPLNELIGMAEGKGPETKGVIEKYFSAIKTLGDEFKILKEVDLSEIKKILGSELARGIENMRKGKVEVEPGYDGVYGKINPFVAEENKPEQPTLF